MTLVLILLSIGTCLCDRQLTLQMPNVDIEKKDAYMCFATPTSEFSGYSLVGYDIDTTRGVAHHIGMAACENYNSNYTYWDCKHDHGNVCSGRAVSLHGQAGTDVVHSRISFQDGVGIRLGPESHVNYIILQVHYRNPLRASDHSSSTTNATLVLTKDRKPFTKQSVLLGSNGFIPASRKNYSCEMIMEWQGIPVTAHTYSIHTHDLGALVEGYLIRNDTMTLIGRHSPQHHGTATYGVEGGGDLQIYPGDIIAARCIFNNPFNNIVHFGTGHADEMCNFSLNFKYRSIEAMAYPRSLRVYQNCQQVTWCHNEIYTANDLCHASRGQSNNSL